MPRTPEENDRIRRATQAQILKAAMDLFLSKGYYSCAQIRQVLKDDVSAGGSRNCQPRCSRFSPDGINGRAMQPYSKQDDRVWAIRSVIALISQKLLCDPRMA